jgi:uncharacterized glyoxalase superfamily protein PhnB
MTQLNAYRSFDGNCAEAMRFYEKTLDGKLEALATYGESPAGDKTPEADRDRSCTPSSRSTAGADGGGCAERAAVRGR